MNNRLLTLLGINKQSFLLHSSALVVFVCIILLIGGADGDTQSPEELVDFLGIICLQLLIPIYIHFALWKFTIDSRRFVVYALGLILLVFGWPFVAADAVIEFTFDDSAPPYAQLVSNTLFGIILGTGIRAIYRSFIRDRELRKLRQQQTDSQLAGLKAQLNPHFLFNTLNNIYGVNLDDSSRGSAMLLELADVMRYHYELSQLDVVPLVKEVGLIRSVVALESLRLRENTRVVLDLPPDDVLRGLEVPPLLLVPFVENAFKHGAHTSRSGTIKLQLDISDDELRFELTNPIYSDRNTVVSGVGIDNVRQRLRLLYADTYQLSAAAEHDVWRVSLCIPLKSQRHG